MRLSRLFPVVVVSLLLSSCASTDGDTAATPASSADTASATGAAKPYNYDKCLVIEKPLTFGGGPFTRVHEGREVKLCCKPCIKTFESDPKIWMAKLDRWDAGGAPDSSLPTEGNGE